MSRKSKGFGQLLRQQHAEQYEEKALGKLEQKVKQGYLGKNVQLVTNLKGEVKMSEVLEDFVDPYLHTVQRAQDFNSLIKLAILAWNCALRPKKEKKQIINERVKELGSKGDVLVRQDLTDFLNELITRKNNFFADNKRVIYEFNLQGSWPKMHISVASSLPNLSAVK